MIGGYNRWTGLGNLAADPESRFLDNGQQMCKFRLAVNEPDYRDKNGEKQVGQVAWVPIVTYGSLAEACQNNLAKGRQVLAEGRINTYEFTRADGQRGFGWDVVATKVIFLYTQNVHPKVNPSTLPDVPAGGPDPDDLPF